MSRSASGGLAATRPASASAVGTLRVGGDLADQADALGLVGVDRIAGEQQFGRLLRPDQVPGSLQNPPTSQIRPRLMNSSANTARSEATRMSA